ncbi:hypothetical protein AB0L70_30460 [Kribbella sp. NPDC051952]|uniref:hypothetical protein n=1 Tax=Kribbella sp. NPDC051952 TaxID=3154851 RepID=UPI00342DE107
MVVSPPPPDSGPLLEACMGAGATLVAIIGGLLVTRYITLESELQASQDRLKSEEARLAEAEDDLRSAKDELRRAEVEYVLDENDVYKYLQSVVVNDGQVEVSKVRNLASVTEFSDEDLLSTLKAWRDEMAKAVGHPNLWNSIPTDKVQLDSWSEFRRGKQLPVSVEIIWEALYNLIADELEERARSHVSYLTPTSMRGIIGSNGVQMAKEIERLRGFVDVARAQTDRQRVETSMAREARARISRPPGLAAGLVVLALLTLATVVVPILFLAPTPATLSYGGGVGIVALFLAAVVVLFGYMTWHVYRLRKLSQSSDGSKDGRQAG